MISKVKFYKISAFQKNCYIRIYLGKKIENEDFQLE